MNRNNNLIISLSALLLLSILVAAYSLLSKGKTVQPVLMVIKGNEFNYANQDSFGKEKF